tara:strand:+ start:644 stop:1501 length:858 start_codon:yes stop_codon:yes gene_type:complete
MINLCTVSDNNYLLKGLTLYESLKKNSKDFILHYLCIDEESYTSLKSFECASLKVYNVDSLVQEDPLLLNLKNSEYKYFCWSLASYFSNYLLLKGNSITYIDSDIYFHDNIEVILKEIGGRDVGIFRHRQFPLSTYRPEGLYNVGVVHFKNTQLGISVSNWWTDAVLNKKYPQLATCGDQKYLDNFPNLCPKDSIYLDENIGHGAPWLWQLYEFISPTKIIWENQEQNLVFTHFSQFQFNGDSYVPSLMHHIYTPLDEYKNNINLKVIYDEYFTNLKLTQSLYKL